MRHRVSMTGKRFGRWVVISVAGKNRWGQIDWNCLCDCGIKKIVCGSSLRCGNTKSCGCLNREIARDRGKISKTHGDSHRGQLTKEYRAWMGMKTRCLNPKNSGYKYYGGRGITICERWLNNFENFLLDVGRAPSSKLSIDRIDNNGNYEPGNCRWATLLQQNQNKGRRK